LLPSNLLITRRRRGRINPVYVELNQENLSVAQLLIQTYLDHLDKRKYDLNEAVSGLEDLGYDYRYIRGLSVLLDRKCVFESKTTVDPLKIRKHVFKITHKCGFPTTPEMRQSILHRSASELGLSIETLENTLYSDLEDELILKTVESITPEALLRWYNLSLIQTLLLSSTELIFTVTGNWQRIFRQIKWFGLIYTIQKREKEYEVRVDGPTSLFKLNRRYGTRLAKLLSYILQSQNWHVKAQILHRRGDRRLLNLELDSQKQGRFFQTLAIPAEKKAIYDSLIEQEFAKHFNLLDTGWILTREPNPIPVGRHVLIPDFLFEKDNLTVYLEVVGFWTPQYLQDKIKKLKLVDSIDLLVVVDKKLACHKLEKLREKFPILYYHKKIPLKPILSYLREKEKLLIIEQIKFLRTTPLSPKNPVVTIAEIAEQFGVLVDAVKALLKERTISGYVHLGDILIQQSTLTKIQKLLEAHLEERALTFTEASRIIQDAGGMNATAILDTLGFKIEWRGIDARSAQVTLKDRKKKKKQFRGFLKS
jgi:predicted nuclease of restriction endonuclease-like RecB superfamily